MPPRSQIRASDADRERVVDRLRDAAADGRIAVHELEERISRALSAKTYGELDPLVKDLPRTGVEIRRRPRSWELARNHPLAAMVVVAFAAVTFVTLAAVAVLASGVWIFALVMFMIGRGRTPRMTRRYRYAQQRW